MSAGVVCSGLPSDDRFWILFKQCRVQLRTNCGGTRDLVHHVQHERYVRRRRASPPGPGLYSFPRPVSASVHARSGRVSSLGLFWEFFGRVQGGLVQAQ